MKLNLSDKVVLITGSSAGIGVAIAEAFHKENCKIALNARNFKKLEVIKERLSNSIAIVGDVTNSAEAESIISEVINHFGKIDILVCNVGSGKSVPPGEETLEEWHASFSKNLWSTINMVEASKNKLSETKGNIVCISSICGLEVFPGAPVTYSVAKAALNAYVKGIARPLANKNIRINAIAAGNILFEGSVWFNKLQEDKDRVELMIKENVPLNCFGLPNDIANLAVFLASDLACFATGSIWPIDGGQTRA